MCQHVYTMYIHWCIIWYCNWCSFDSEVEKFLVETIKKEALSKTSKEHKQTILDKIGRLREEFPQFTPDKQSEDTKSGTGAVGGAIYNTSVLEETMGGAVCYTAVLQVSEGGVHCYTYVLHGQRVWLYVIHEHLSYRGQWLGQCYKSVVHITIGGVYCYN